MATITTFVFAARQSLIKLGRELSAVERMSIEAQITRAEGMICKSPKIYPASINDIKHLIRTEKDKSFFWSGNTNGVGGEATAIGIAEKRGGSTLEGLLTKQNIEMPLWDASNPTVVKLWEEVSFEFANQVSGEVRAVIGRNLRSGNIWETVELPMLRANPKVTKITIVDPESLIETTIFKRP